MAATVFSSDKSGQAAFELGQNQRFEECQIVGFGNERHTMAEVQVTSIEFKKMR